MKILKEAWVATLDDIADLKKFKEDTASEKARIAADQEFDSFAVNFSLSDSQKVILKDLKKVHTDKSYEDILKSTWFVEQSLLEKAKISWGVKGNSLWIPESKKEEVLISPTAARKLNLKPASELNKIKSQFNL